MYTTQETIINASARYYTWNAFKKDLELNLGHYVCNNLWLQAKPKKALPWSSSDMKETIVYVKKAEEQYLY